MCGRFCIVLNGEIYNHWELRREMGGSRSWIGRSDTETLVEGIATWGVTDTLRRVNGMFAFAVWDSLERRLILARDRIGEKPVYWGEVKGRFVFSSELRPILKSGLGPFELNPRAVDALLNLGYIPDPLCILLDIGKLEPGIILEVQAGEGGFSTRREPYWTLSEVMARAVRERPRRNKDEWLEEVESALKRAVKLRLLSDVPLGAFLSGGVDSSLIVAMMAGVSGAPVRTFTVGMPGEWDESPRARRMAQHLGTVHTEIPITEQDCLEVIPELPRIYSEPLGDSSQVPTFLVSKVARRDVTVALSGDGGDELFAGYHRHFAARRIWQRLGRVPGPIRRIADRAISSPYGERLARLASWAGSSGGRNRRRMLRLQKGFRLIGAQTEAELYRRLVVQWPEGRAPSGSARGWNPELPRWAEELEGLDTVERFMAYDLAMALPGDMLVKVDRATMAHGLEARVPFLDHELVGLALQVPPELKVDGTQGKLLLRRMLARHAPTGWMEEPEAKSKLGFGIPIARWLRVELREWAESLLSPSSLADRPWLDSRAVQRRWSEFQNGAAWEHPFWSILMLQAWVSEYREYLCLQ